MGVVIGGMMTIHSRKTGGHLFLEAAIIVFTNDGFER